MDVVAGRDGAADAVDGGPDVSVLRKGCGSSHICTVEITS